jgi:hypothetical protein
MTTLMTAADEPRVGFSSAPVRSLSFKDDTECYTWVAAQLSFRARPGMSKARLVRDLALRAFDMSLAEFLSRSREGSRGPRSRDNARQKITCLMHLLTNATRGQVYELVQRDRHSVLDSFRKYQREISRALDEVR